MMKWYNQTPEQINNDIKNYNKMLTIMDDIKADKHLIMCIPKNNREYVLREIKDTYWLFIYEVQQFYNIDNTYTDLYCEMITEGLSHGYEVDCNKKFYDFIVTHLSDILTTKNAVHFFLKCNPSKEVFKEIVMMYELYINNEIDSITKQDLINELYEFAKKFDMQNTLQFLITVKGA